MPNRSIMRRTRRRTAVAAATVLTVLALDSGAAAMAAPAIPVLPCTAGPTTLTPGVQLACLAGSPDLSDTHVATVVLSTAGPRFDVVQAHDAVFQFDPSRPADQHADAPVSGMTPEGAVLGINGGYFDINLNDGQSYTGQACGGMVSQGRILKTPPAEYGRQANLVVRRNGTMSIGEAGFTGTIVSPTGTRPLTSINDLSDAGPQPGCPADLVPLPSAGTGITLITPDMGKVTLEGKLQIPDAVVVTGVRVGDRMTVTGVTGASSGATEITTLPALTGDQVALLGSGSAGGAWLSAHARVADVLTVSGRLTVEHVPADDVQTLLSAGARVIENGSLCTPATSAPPTPQSTIAPCGVFPTSGTHAETMVGVSRDGRRAFLVVVDLPGGYGGVSPQDAGAFLRSLGAWNGLLLDGGGSTTMVARTSSSAPLSLVNNTDTGEEAQNPQGPGNQRYVANALVVYPADLSTTLMAAPPQESADTTTPSVALLILLGSTLVAAGGVLIVSRRRTWR